jgi:hypothetical protein
MAHLNTTPEDRSFMYNDRDYRSIDPELQKDLNHIIKNVESFFIEEQDSILLSLLRQKRVPELFEKNCQN